MRSRCRDRPDLARTTAERLRAGRDRRSTRPLDLRQRDPEEYVRRSMASMADHVRAMLAFQQRRRGHVRLRQQHPGAGARQAGVTDAFDFPGFVPAFIRPLFCEGKGPFRWAALSGDPEDICSDRRGVLRAVPRRRGAAALDPHGPASRSPFQGLPARICWLGYGERAQAGLRFNELVARGEVSAPIVIGRDHLDAGSRRLAEPRDGGDAGRLRRHRRLADPQRAASTPPPARPG